MTESGQTSQDVSVLDNATIAFAGRVFGFARCGRVDELAEQLDMGLPPNLRNDKGDTLLMLASYHGNRRRLNTDIGQASTKSFEEQHRPR